MTSEKASTPYPGPFPLFLGAPSPEIKDELMDDYFSYILPPRPAQDADIAADNQIMSEAGMPGYGIDTDSDKIHGQTAVPNPELRTMAASSYYNRPSPMQPYDMLYPEEQQPGPERRLSEVPFKPHTSPILHSMPQPATKASQQRMLNMNKTLGLSLSIPSAHEPGLPDLCRDEPQDFTSMLKRAEAELGRTGMYDRHGPDMQKTLAAIAANQIGRLLKKLDDKMLSHGSFPNRVHILTVMRSIIQATMETPASAPAGIEASKQLAYYQSRFLTAVTTLTRDQRDGLKVLDGGLWMREMQGTVELAQTLGVSADLEQALVYIDC